MAVRGVFAAIAALGVALAAWAEEPPDALPPSARDVLELAFENRYGCDTRQVVRLEVESARGNVLHRRLEVVSKLIGDRTHALGRFTDPPNLRGTTLLTIENVDRSDDHFLYLPALKRARRFTSAQRADSFLGTDLAYEDFERRQTTDFEVTNLTSDRVDGEPVWVVSALPLYDSGYERAEFRVAQADHAILEIRWFKRQAETPFKVLEAPRSDQVRQDGHVLPTRMVVRNLAKRSETRVFFDQLVVNPPIDDSVFSKTALEMGRPIRGPTDDAPPPGAAATSR